MTPSDLLIQGISMTPSDLIQGISCADPLSFLFKVLVVTTIVLIQSISCDE